MLIFHHPNLKEIDSLTPVIRQYFYEGNYEKVLEIAPTLIADAQEAGLYRQEYRVRSILGNSFATLDDTESANNFLLEGLEKAKERKDTISMLSSYIDLGNTFIEIEPNKAINYLENALDLKQDTPTNMRAMFIVHNNLAETYVKTKDFEEAEFHLDSAEMLLDEDVFKDFKSEYRAVTLHTHGAIHLERKQYSEAIDAITQSLELGKNKLDQNYLIRNYVGLMSAYENLEQYKNVNDIRHTYDSLITKRNEAQKIKQQKIAVSRFNVDTYRQQLRQSQLETKVSLQEQERSKLVLRFFYISFAVLLAA